MSQQPAPHDPIRLKDDAMRQHLDDAQRLAVWLRDSCLPGSEEHRRYSGTVDRINVARWGC